VSLGKQAVGFPATVALMTAAGCSEDALDDARRALEGIWLGLQFHDDVIDWEDDWQRAGAWAACLAKGRGASIDDDEAVETLRTNVLASGVLAQMQKHDELDALFKAERAHPGYALRAHQLRHLMLAGSPLVDGDTIRHSREGGNP
jgi:hypothetical protein